MTKLPSFKIKKVLCRYPLVLPGYVNPEMTHAEPNPQQRLEMRETDKGVLLVWSNLLNKEEVSTSLIPNENIVQILYQPYTELNDK